MAKPTKPTKRATSTRPAKHAQPAKPTKPTTSTRPARRAKPTQGSTSAKPTKPTKRATSTRPAKPAKSAKPAKPAKHAKPAKSAKPAKPAKPAKRARPAKPTKPARPRKQPAGTTRAAPPPVRAKPVVEPDRATRIATAAAERGKALGEASGPVQLGSITVPSGTLAIFDVGLMGYLPREALDPMLICAPVPSDRALAVVGTRVGAGRFAACWDHVAIELAGPDRHDVAHARKLGEAACDFARLICMDRAAIDHWQHEDSLDQLADFVFSGRDEAQLAKALGAKRLPHGGGHGFTDLPLAEAEAKADRAAELKAEHKWLLVTELRPHSHHFDALAAARASPSGAGVLEIGGARMLLFFTSWGNGIYPVYLDVDQDARPVRIRIQLAAVEAKAPDGAVARPPAW